MKTTIYISFFLAAFLFSVHSYGQKWASDPTYSPHNYKHPNKAAVAKQSNLHQNNSAKSEYALVPVTENYKAQNRVIKREVRKANVLLASDNNERRNYKQQFAPRTKGEN